MQVWTKLLEGAKTAFKKGDFDGLRGDLRSLAQGLGVAFDEVVDVFDYQMKRNAYAKTGLTH